MRSFVPSLFRQGWPPFLRDRRADTAGRADLLQAQDLRGEASGEIAGGMIGAACIFANADDHPRIFATSPSTARRLAGADLVVHDSCRRNGMIGYALGKRLN